MKMKILIALYVLAVLLLAASPAWAGVTCQQIGNITYCTTDTGQTWTCQRIGSFTYCN